jgi:type II secretory pathway pseudopilin PulG
MKKRPKPRGFTLVVTISLLILLVILAVGLLSLSSISLRSSARSVYLQQAQANARMAMMMALGDLQTELGPDRRINCPSNMDSAAHPTQSQWIAVYDSWNATEDTRPDSSTRFRRYLVSGDPTALRNRDAVKTAQSNGKTIVGAGTLGTVAQNGIVTAALMPIHNSEGQYAWWIAR